MSTGDYRPCVPGCIFIADSCPCPVHSKPNEFSLPNWKQVAEQNGWVGPEKVTGYNGIIADLTESLAQAILIKDLAMLECSKNDEATVQVLREDLACMTEQRDDYLKRLTSSAKRVAELEALLKRGH